MDLPDGATDRRAPETALAVALGGAICPVPFVMSAAAVRIARPAAGRSRRARAALAIAAATMAVQALALVALAAWALT